MNAYEMVIRNTAKFIQAQDFGAARVIAIGFAKLYEDVLNDLVTVELDRT